MSTRLEAVPSVGSLADVSLAEVLGDVRTRGFTGSLVLTDAGGEEHTVVFDGGRALRGTGSGLTAFTGRGSAVSKTRMGARTMSKKPFKSLYLLAALVPLLTGAKGQGCAGEGNGAAIFSKSKAPDMSGGWDVTYDDRLDIEITIGGAVYTKELGPEGGAFTIDHDGQPITFDLDCSRPEVVCPSEVWPDHVSFRQDDPTYPHRVWMQVPSTECQGNEVAPDPATCGPETNNPDCDKVCDGETVTTQHEAFGTVNESGDHLLVGLNATVASNGINCLMIGGSVAEGDLTTEGSAETEDWEVVSGAGDVVTAFAGGCLWVGDPNMDGKLEALVLGGSIRLATGWTAKKN